MKYFFTESERTRLFYPQRYVRTLRACLDYASEHRLECRPNTELIKARVERGAYESVVKLIVGGNTRLYSITGATGSGKSTFALLEMILGSTCLVICSSPVNVANQDVEFNLRIPDTANRHGLNVLLPTVASCDFETYCDPDAQLTLCTAEQFNNFVAVNQCFPPVDYLVLDEYHLNSPPVIKARMILRHCYPPKGSPQEKQKVVFVSATPPDEEPPPVRTDGLTVQRMEIPDPLTEPLPDIYRLSKHPPYSNQVMLIVADSCAAAHELTARLNKAGDPAYSLCKCPTPESAAAQLARNTRKFTFVATPDTEAGITVPCSIMINPGLAARVEFSGGVCVPDVFPLGPRQSNQRLGRAGRLGHTIVYTADTDVGKHDTPSLVELASGYLAILALTGGHPRGLEADMATSRFNRLLQVDKAAASRASIAPAPMLALYRADNHGKRYREFGGRAEGFVEQNAQDFKLFKWPSGSAYAPFVDLCSEHDPSEGSSPGLQKAIADTIVARNPHVMDNVDLAGAVKAAQDKPELYEAAIWGAMQQLHGSPKTVGIKGNPPRNWKESRNSDYTYMLTEEGANAWKILESLGGTFEAWADKTGESKNGEDSYLLVRQFKYRGEVVTYNPKPLLGSDNLVDTKALEKLFLPFFTPIMATTALLGRPEHSIDLVRFAHLKTRCNNTWFKSVV